MAWDGEGGKDGTPRNVQKCGGGKKKKENMYSAYSERRGGHDDLQFRAMEMHANEKKKNTSHILQPIRARDSLFIVTPQSQ